MDFDPAAFPHGHQVSIVVFEVISMSPIRLLMSICMSSEESMLASFRPVLCIDMSMAVVVSVVVSVSYSSSLVSVTLV